MAEICVDCWCKEMGSADEAKKVLISRELELCEECGQYKPVVVRYKMRYIWEDRLQELIENLQHYRSQRGK